MILDEDFKNHPNSQAIYTETKLSTFWLNFFEDEEKKGYAGTIIGEGLNLDDVLRNIMAMNLISIRKLYEAHDISDYCEHIPHQDKYKILSEQDCERIDLLSRMKAPIHHAGDYQIKDTNYKFCIEAF